MEICEMEKSEGRIGEIQFQETEENKTKLHFVLF
jgi:hypothetical protein